MTAIYAVDWKDHSPYYQQKEQNNNDDTEKWLKTCKWRHILAFSLRMDMINLICDYSDELKTMGINKGTVRDP